MVEDGLDVLDWLIAVQTAPAGHLSPIGNGWWPRGGEKSRFDQQPIEATALLLAAEVAYQVTGDERYRSAMERAYAWFLGDNDLGLAGRRSGARGVLRRPHADGRQHQPGRRVHAHVADRARAHPGSPRDEHGAAPSTDDEPAASPSVARGAGR